MEIIKRKILLRDLGGDLYFKIPLYQSIDNIGVISDLEFGYTINSDFNLGLYTLPNEENYVISDYFKEAGIISGATDSKLNRLRSYNELTPYIKDFDIKKEDYNNYKLELITGVDRITKINGDEYTYTFNAKLNLNIGTSGQTTGLLYVDNPENQLTLPLEFDNTNTTTKVQFYGEGFNILNSSISPQIQEEYLIGIINKPEVESDIFIDRTTYSVLDKHLRLSEIESLDHLMRYGNKFYKINRD